MKKKLPRAVLWTADDMRKPGPGAYPQPGAAPSADLSESQNARASASNIKAPDNIIEMTPKTDGNLNSAGSAEPRPKSSSGDVEAARRRRWAIAIVERHANLSAVGGAIPMPIANIASITAIIVRMVKSLSKVYDVPFERNRARAIVIGLMGGIMPAGIATAATSVLIYFVPGYNLLGLAVSSVTASATARSIGHIFIDHFENGSKLVDIHTAIMR
jgi:uncharacterized protein (DUF697 family)